MRRMEPVLRGVVCLAMLLASASIVRAQVTLVNMTPQSRSGETNQNSEPHIAVNPSNPQQLVSTAFT